MSTFTEHYNLECLARRSLPGAPLPPSIPSGRARLSLPFVMSAIRVLL